MGADALVLPDNKVVRAHMLAALISYWPSDPKPVESLPVVQRSLACHVSGPLRLVEIVLPEWATNCGVGGMLLVPQEAVDENHTNAELWRYTDWWLAAFLLLEGWHERVWEQEHGPIHSYSFRLTGWDERAWDRAWVNRIALFLRKWVEQVSGDEALNRIGPLSKSSVHMTHDVDAVAKTLPIRLKQCGFNLFNAARSLSRGQLRQAIDRLKKAIQFMIGQENWWGFDQLLQYEADAGIQATYHFYADKEPKNMKRWLLDPDYDITAPKQRALLGQIIKYGHIIGVHPGFETWQASNQIAAQRFLIEAAAGAPVTRCRQHWLRFSWKDTWQAQDSASLALDTTLMFNDRPGFRNSSALIWQPHKPNQAGALSLRAMPTLFMDSHFYDYQPMSSSERQDAMLHWIRECRDVNGKAAILWHPHTLTRDYGWSDGFRDALSLIKESMPCR